MNRQDSLYDQMVDVLTLARVNGCYDAYDWIADRFAESDWSLIDGHLEPPHSGSSTPSDSSVTRSEVSTNLSTNDPSVTRALRALDGAIAEIETANGDCTASAYGSLLAARDLLTDGYEPAEGGADPDMVALNTQHLFDRDANDPPDHEDACPWMDGENACTCPDEPAASDPTGHDCGHNYNDPTNPCPTCTNDRSVRPVTGGSGVETPAPAPGSTPSPTSEETKK